MDKPTLITQTAFSLRGTNGGEGKFAISVYGSVMHGHRSNVEYLIFLSLTLVYFNPSNHVHYCLDIGIESDRRRWFDGITCINRVCENGNESVDRPNLPSNNTPGF